MNLAVLTFEHADNPKGVPNAWPAEVKELGEGTSLPDNNWLLMTSVEYTAYIALHQASFDAWLAGYAPDSGTISEEEATTVGHTITCGYAGVASTGRSMEIGGNPTITVPYPNPIKAKITSISVYNGGGNTTGELSLYINGSLSTAISLNAETQKAEALTIALEVGDLLNWEVTSGSFYKVNVYTLIQSKVVH